MHVSLRHYIYLLIPSSVKENASCTISIKKDGKIEAGQIFHLNDVSSSRSVNFYANLTLPEKKNDSDL